MAEKAPRHALVSNKPARDDNFSPEPRSGRKFRSRPANQRSHIRRAAARTHGRNAARPRHTHALPRAGVRSVLHRFCFADHKPDLAELVEKGRHEFLAQWRGLALPEMQPVFDNPSDPATFERCKLDFSELQNHQEQYLLHRDLLKLRREDPVISQQGAHGLDGAVFPRTASSFGTSRRIQQRPITGRQSGSRFALQSGAGSAARSSLRVRMVGSLVFGKPAIWRGGTPPLDSDQNWRIPGEAAVLLFPKQKPKPQSKPLDQTTKGHI